MFFVLLRALDKNKNKKREKRKNPEPTFTDSKLTVFVILFNLISVFLFSLLVKVALNKLKL